MTQSKESGSLDEIAILAINPLWRWAWRWAWVPLHLTHTWALPCFRKRTAERAAREWVRAHSGSPCILLRRTGVRSFDLEGQIR